jgi:magnesium-transporting ATPase (P-type)
LEFVIFDLTQPLFNKYRQKMISLSNEYMNALATQIIFISVFLGGFSATLLVTLLVADNERKMMKVLIVSSASAAILFIIATFAMTKVVMVTTPGFPLEVPEKEMIRARTFGALALMGGVFSLMFTIGASGWLKSRRLGITTTLLGSLGFITFVILMS